jgi:AraC-like DNA-binding protein
MVHSAEEQRPSRVRDTREFLKPLENRSPDALADLLDSVHCEGFVYRVTAHQAPWCLENGRVGDAIGYFIVTGSARLSLGRDLSIDLYTSDYAIVAPQLPHRLQSLQTHHETLIGRTAYGLNVAQARPLFRSLPPVLVLQGRSDVAQKHVELSRLIAELHDELEPGNKALVSRLTEAAFIFSVLTYRRDEAAKGHSSTIDPSTLRIAPSLHAMHRHPERLFCSEFARRTGETPARYLARIRLEQASKLLRHSTLAIATIAAHVGYSDPVTLGRAFRRHFGMSLGAFRSAVE